MMNKMTNMWNDRYSKEDYAYGIEPNNFFKECIDKYDFCGKVLLPAEGEGRNAVFAAKKGLEVTAFDISEEGKKKALKLAKSQGVSIEYEVGELSDLHVLDKEYDLVAFIFAHFPPSILSTYHKKIASVVKKGGFVILEGFSKNNLSIKDKNPKVGGPSNIEMLFSVESIQSDFSDFEILKLEEVEVELHEGNYHNGLGKVIRFIGRKG